MPTLTRWFLKSSFVCLTLGLLVGVWQQIPQLTISGLFPVYLHILTVGWLTQLIFGIALWMFPKYSSERPRGSYRLGWMTFTFLNVGLALRVIFEPLSGIHPSELSGSMLVISATLQWLAGVGFFINTWKRVKEK